jgi:hypothetical protein
VPQHHAIGEPPSAGTSAASCNPRLEILDFPRERGARGALRDVRP